MTRSAGSDSAEPAVAWLTRHRLRRDPAAVLASVAAIVVPAGIVAVLAVPLVNRARQLTDDLPTYVNDLTKPGSPLGSPHGRPPAPPTRPAAYPTAGLPRTAKSSRIARAGPLGRSGDMRPFAGRTAKVETSPTGKSRGRG